MVEWAERAGIPYSTLANRLAFGWPVDRALSEPIAARTWGRSATINGVEVPLASLGRKASRLAASRIRNGWDPTQAASVPPQRGVRFELDGQWLTLVELSRMSGLGRKTIRDRIEKRGMTTREAISIPPANAGSSKRAA
jgi:hypothetical protein